MYCELLISGSKHVATLREQNVWGKRYLHDIERAASGTSHSAIELEEVYH